MALRGQNDTKMFLNKETFCFDLCQSEKRLKVFAFCKAESFVNFVFANTSHRIKKDGYQIKLPPSANELRRFLLWNHNFANVSTNKKRVVFRAVDHLKTASVHDMSQKLNWDA